jgi:hypothetical protein
MDWGFDVSHWHRGVLDGWMSRFGVMSISFASYFSFVRHTSILAWSGVFVLLSVQRNGSGVLRKRAGSFFADWGGFCKYGFSIREAMGQGHWHSGSFGMWIRIMDTDTIVEQ